MGPFRLADPCGRSCGHADLSRLFGDLPACPSPALPPGTRSEQWKHGALSVPLFRVWTVSGPGQGPHQADTCCLPSPEGQGPGGLTVQHIGPLEEDAGSAGAFESDVGLVTPTPRTFSLYSNCPLHPTPPPARPLSVPHLPHHPSMQTCCPCPCLLCKEGWPFPPGQLGAGAAQPLLPAAAHLIGPQSLQLGLGWGHTARYPAGWTPALGAGPFPTEATRWLEVGAAPPWSPLQSLLVPSVSAAASPALLAPAIQSRGVRTPFGHLPPSPRLGLSMPPARSLLSPRPCGSTLDEGQCPELSRDPQLSQTTLDSGWA